MNYPYTHVVLGGTFDLLHLGHKSILTHTFKIGQFVTIGLTTDQFNKKRGKPSFQNQNLRLEQLRRFLRAENYLKRCKAILINDIFGITLKDPTLQAIVVTSTTKSSAHLINKKREARGLRALNIISVPLVKDKMGQVISSTRIRNGEINTLGQNYKKELLKIAGKRLVDHVRNQLKKPLGQIITMDKIHPNGAYISVGDITTISLLRKKVQPILSIVDLKVQRTDISHNLTYDTRVKNPPGQISRALILAVNKSLKKLLVPSSTNLVLLVNGEEDLATIPTILLSPLGAIVLYGQPQKGLVEVRVDLEIKDYLLTLIHIL